MGIINWVSCNCASFDCLDELQKIRWTGLQCVRLRTVTVLFNSGIFAFFPISVPKSHVVPAKKYFIMCFIIQICIPTHSKKQFQETIFASIINRERSSFWKSPSPYRQNSYTFDLVKHKRKMSPHLQCITISTAGCISNIFYCYLSSRMGNFCFLQMLPGQLINIGKVLIIREQLTMTNCCLSI